MNGTQSKPKVSYIFIQIIIVQAFIKFGARYGSGHTQPCNLRFTHKIRRRIPYSSVSCGTTPLLLHTLSVCLTAVLECVEYRASYLSFGLCVVCTQHANHHLPSFLMFQRGLWDLLEHVTRRQLRCQQQSSSEKTRFFFQALLYRKSPWWALYLIEDSLCSFFFHPPKINEKNNNTFLPEKRKV